MDVQQATSAVGQELLDALGTLLERAGAVRGDVRVADLTALLVGASRAAEHAGWDPEVQARTLAVILDGLRPRP